MVILSMPFNFQAVLSCATISFIQRRVSTKLSNSRFTVKWNVRYEFEANKIATT